MANPWLLSSPRAPRPAASLPTSAAFACAETAFGALIIGAAAAPLANRAPTALANTVANALANRVG